AQPGEIGAAPDVAERQAELRRERDEVSMLARWVGQVCRITARGRGLIHPPQVRLCAVATWSVGPVELSSEIEIGVEGGVCVQHNRTGEGRAEFCARRIEKWRTQSDVLRPAEWPIQSAEVFQRLVNPDVFAIQPNAPGELQLRFRQNCPLNQLVGRIAD